MPHQVEKDRPVYAFKHLGGDGRRIALTTVEGIAERFVTELLKARPQGPFILVGYSFGGIVAFEMAHRLRALGHRVPMTMVLDSYAPHLHAEAMEHDHHFLSKVKNTVLQALVERRLAQGRKLSGRLNHHHIIHTYSQAITGYVPEPTPDPILVVKAAMGWGPTDLGWYRLAAGGFVLQELPCDHVHLVKEPHASDLFDIIRSGINHAGC